MTPEIEFRKFKEVDLKGAPVIEGFPGVGILGAIAASYLIETLSLDQICALESEDFPPVSMIYSAKPKFPARIYAREDIKLAVFIPVRLRKIVHAKNPSDFSHSILYYIHFSVPSLTIVDSI